MDERNYRRILEEMDFGIAFFRMVMDEKGKVTAAVIEACNERYRQIAQQAGIDPGHLLHQSYFDLSPHHDPRWDYYIYHAAILREHVHGGFRNTEFGTWMEISGGPAVEEDTCWLMFIDHTHLRNENDRLMKERNIDQLTGVRNRNAYEDAIAAMKASDKPAGVILADLNGLKEINDTQGHREGDYMIDAAAVYLTSLNSRELPYRIGGDEFVLLISGCTKKDVNDLAAKIRSFKDLSLSCGGAWCSHGSLIDDALKEADAAMYEDKRLYYRSHERRHVR